MYKTPDLRILFPTSFSEACFRTSRAIAQLADTCRVSLTLAHVMKPGGSNLQRRRELDSFMAEADHYDYCRRVLVEAEDSAQAIGDLCDEDPFDLVMAPSSDRLGLNKLFTSSFRARLMTRCKTPVWTAGSCLDRMVFKPSLKTIACLLDFECLTDTHLRLASSLAWKMGARLRIVAVISPIHEGILARSLDSRGPLTAEVASDWIRSAFSGRPCPEFDVAVGETSAELSRMLCRCDADLAFVGPGQGLGGIFVRKFASHLDRLPCPVVCIEGASAGFASWSFQHDAAAAETRSVVPARDRAMAS